MANATKNYIPDASVLDERLTLDETAAPVFHKGSHAGCIVLHGLGGTPANVRVISDRLIGLGYTVIAPMLPGHGETLRAQNASTYRQWLSCAEAAYDKLKAEGCTQIFALGLSLGGILCGVLAAERTLDGLCFVCAPVRMQRFLHNVRRISPFIPVVRYIGPQNPSRYAQMYNGLATGKLRDLNRLSKLLLRRIDNIRCPILILQAAYDDKVDPASAQLVRARAVNAPSIAEFLLENSPHGCTYGPERDLAASLCTDFVQNIVDSAPQNPL